MCDRQLGHHLAMLVSIHNQLISNGWWHVLCTTAGHWPQHAYAELIHPADLQPNAGVAQFYGSTDTIQYTYRSMLQYLDHVEQRLG